MKEIILILSIELILISKSKSKKISSIKSKQTEYLEEMNKLNYSKNKLTNKENQLERSV